MSSNKKCYAAMVKDSTSDEFKKKHEEGQIYRAVMDGASYVQGSLPLEIARRRDAKKTGADPNFFEFWETMHTRKKPHPTMGSMWVNKGSELQSTKFVQKFKEVQQGRP